MAESPSDAPAAGGASVPGFVLGDGVTSTYQGLSAKQRRDQFEARKQAALEKNPLVLISRDNPVLDPATGAPRPYASAPETVTATELMRQWELMPAAEKRKWARKLALAGLYTGEVEAGQTLEEFLDERTIADATAAYANLVNGAAVRYSQQGLDITLDEVLDAYLDWGTREDGSSKFFAPAGEGAGAGGSVEELDPVKRRVEVSRDIFSPSQAKAYARVFIGQELGRAPTEEEFADFVSALQEEQRENPTRTVTRYRYNDDNQQIGSSSTSTGGVDPEEFALEYAQSQPGWAEWQAIGTYLPALMEALGSTTGG